jgi:hypothetical protein
MHRLHAGLCLLGLSALARPPVSTSARVVVRVDCDSLVATRASDPLRYRQRGDRCEGVYGKSVSGSSTLRVAALVESVEAFDDSSALPLRIEWTPPPGDSVTVRASAIRAGLYYRMETTHPIAESRFVWPSDVRASLRLSSADIGVTGVTAKSIGGARREVLVPLRISQRKPPVRSASYRLSLWPTVGMSDVYVTIAATGADGVPTRYLQRVKKLDYGYYPAERPIVVRLPALAARGVYLVRIAATREDGGSATREFLLYHAGASNPTHP